MAYRLASASNHYVAFNKTAFASYTAGPITIAALFKLNATGGSGRRIVGFNQVSIGPERVGMHKSSNYFGMNYNNDEVLYLSFTNTSIWYIAVATFGGGSAISRGHLWNGTSWAHQAQQFGTVVNKTIQAADELRVGHGNISMLAQDMDIVCAGIKRADSTDLQVQNLSPTDFQTWRDFGFHWLIGFEASAALTDVGLDGTGHETTRSGTSLVADPPGWSWAAAPTAVSSTLDLRHRILGSVSSTLDLRYAILPPIQSSLELQYEIRGYPPLDTPWVPLFKLTETP